MGLIAVGDIHGCVKTLEALLERLDLHGDDHLIFVGDYVDRGPDSYGVIEHLLKLSTSFRCTFLRGNHEAMMLDYLLHGDYEPWSVNGGIETLRSYIDGAPERYVPATHVQFLKDTNLYFSTNDFFFVHAGLKPHLTISENLRVSGEDVFLWERSHLGGGTPVWEKTVVCGHTPQPEPLNTPKLINIDTGCVYHAHPQMGHLCGVRLPERIFTLVPYQG